MQGILFILFRIGRFRRIVDKSLNYCYLTNDLFGIFVLKASRLSGKLEISSRDWPFWSSCRLEPPL